MRAPVESLRELFQSTTSSTSLLRRTRSRTADEQVSTPQIRVYIKRHLVVTVNGQRITRTYNIAEGELRPIPPGSGVLGEPVSEDEAVDYEGEIKCDPSVTVGGFNVGRLGVLVSFLNDTLPLTSTDVNIYRTTWFCPSHRQTLPPPNFNHWPIHIRSGSLQTLTEQTNDII
jgi:hypothetical protein